MRVTPEAAAAPLPVPAAGVLAAGVTGAGLGAGFSRWARLKRLETYSMAECTSYSWPSGSTMVTGKWVGIMLISYVQVTVMVPVTGDPTVGVQVAVMTVVPAATGVITPVVELTVAVAGVPDANVSAPLELLATAPPN